MNNSFRPSRLSVQNLAQDRFAARLKHKWGECACDRLLLASAFPVKPIPLLLYTIEKSSNRKISSLNSKPPCHAACSREHSSQNAGPTKISSRCPGALVSPFMEPLVTRNSFFRFPRVGFLRPSTSHTFSRSPHLFMIPSIPLSKRLVRSTF